jgi:hypothetical protein
MTRYILTEPVKDGYAWWSVRDTKSEHGINFAVAEFYKYMPNAEQEAKALCDRLNRAG